MKTINENSSPDGFQVRVVLENEQDKVPVDGSIEDAVKSTVVSCLVQEGFSVPCQVDITLSDNDRIREINKRHRGIDRPTDVLSFPLVDMYEGKILSSEGDVDMEEGVLLLGDLVISMEKAVQQAEEYGHSFLRELTFLTSHGVFHLLGYDHQDEEQEKNMFGRQEAVLGKLGFGRP